MLLGWREECDLVEHLKKGRHVLFNEALSIFLISYMVLNVLLMWCAGICNTLYYLIHHPGAVLSCYEKGTEACSSVLRAFE